MDLLSTMLCDDGMLSMLWLFLDRYHVASDKNTGYPPATPPPPATRLLPSCYPLSTRGKVKQDRRPAGKEVEWGGMERSPRLGRGKNRGKVCASCEKGYMYIFITEIGEMQRDVVMEKYKYIKPVE